jgi:hypothetical protein
VPLLRLVQAPGRGAPEAWLFGALRVLFGAGRGALRGPVQAKGRGARRGALRGLTGPYPPSAPALPSSTPAPLHECACSAWRGGALALLFLAPASCALIPALVPDSCVCRGSAGCVCGSALLALSCSCS